MSLSHHNLKYFFGTSRARSNSSLYLGEHPLRTWNYRILGERKPTHHRIEKTVQMWSQNKQEERPTEGLIPGRKAMRQSRERSNSLSALGCMRVLVISWRMNAALADTRCALAGDRADPQSSRSRYFSINDSLSITFPTARLFAIPITVL